MSEDEDPGFIALRMKTCDQCGRKVMTMANDESETCDQCKKKVEV